MSSDQVIIPVLTFLLGSLATQVFKAVPKGIVYYLRRKFFIRGSWIRGPRSDVKVLEWEELGGAWTFRGRPATGWKLLLHNQGPYHIVVHRCQITGAIYTKRSLWQRVKFAYRRIRHLRFHMFMLKMRIRDMRTSSSRNHISDLLSSYESPSGKSMPRISNAWIKSVYMAPGSSMTIDVCFAQHLTSHISGETRRRWARFTLSLSDWDIVTSPQDYLGWQWEQV